MKLLLVGELNPYGADPEFALYHLPRRASGNRLREHLGLHDHTYEAIDKVNLCLGKWSISTARVLALGLLEQGEYDLMVLLGAKVRAAFSGPGFFESALAPEPYNVALVTLPHPSGLNQLWNDPHARKKARLLLRVWAPEIPWGETER